MGGDGPSPAVYFLSDYGTADVFVGLVHAVLHRQAPGVPVVDLTHAVVPFDVTAGADALARAVPWLGAGVVLAVVDPGVATGRRGVAVAVDPGRADGPRWLVGPDNGLLAPAARILGGPIGARALPGRSSFDGRDVFAPAAAHLVTGRRPDGLGEAVAVASLSPGPDVPVDRSEVGLETTSVAHVDRFGNVQLRAGPDALDRLGVGPGDRLAVAVGGASPVVARRVVAFGDLADGGLGVMVDADGRLAVVLDRAAAGRLLAGSPPGPVTVVLAPSD